MLTAMTSNCLHHSLWQTIYVCLLQERRKVDESGADCSLPDSLESSIALITTAQPTVRARNKRASKSLLVSTSEVVRIRAAEAASDEDVDVEDDQSADAADDEVYHSLMAAAGITADDTAEKSAELSPAADTTAAETQDDAIKEEELEKPEPAINSEDSIDANGSSDEDSEHENGMTYLLSIKLILLSYPPKVVLSWPLQL